MATRKKPHASKAPARTIVPASQDPVASAYIAEMERLYGKPNLSDEEVRRVIGEALGDRLLSELVIQDRR